MGLVLMEASAGSANSALTTAVTQIANDAKANINAVLPIALGVVGIALAVMIGLKVFKRFTNKA